MDVHSCRVSFFFFNYNDGNIGIGVLDNGYPCINMRQIVARCALWYEIKIRKSTTGKESNSDAVTISDEAKESNHYLCGYKRTSTWR